MGAPDAVAITGPLQNLFEFFQYLFWINGDQGDKWVEMSKNK